MFSGIWIVSVWSFTFSVDYWFVPVLRYWGELHSLSSSVFLWLWRYLQYGCLHFQNNQSREEGTMPTISFTCFRGLMAWLLLTLSFATFQMWAYLRNNDFGLKRSKEWYQRIYKYIIRLSQSKFWRFSLFKLPNTMIRVLRGNI